MNSRERVFATLDHKHPDRVPIAEMWIDAKIARSILPGASSSNDLAEYLGLDMVTAMSRPWALRPRVSAAKNTPNMKK